MSRPLTMSAEEEREYRSLGRFPAAQKAFAELDAERAEHDATSKELDEARAHVERLREALEGMRVAYHNLWDRCVSSGAFVRVGNVHDLSALKVCQAALAATPAQSLADVERRVVGRCAKVATSEGVYMAARGVGARSVESIIAVRTTQGAAESAIRALAPEVAR